MTTSVGTSTPTPLFSDRAYNVLKYIAQIFLPALGGLYFGLSEIWGLPYGAEIVGTITVIDTFLGVVLLLSARSYNASEAKYDGALVVDTSDPEKDVYSFEVNEPLELMREKNELTLKVVENPLNSGSR